MDVWYFRWMSLYNSIELWRSTVHNLPVWREWCIDRNIQDLWESFTTQHRWHNSAPDLLTFNETAANRLIMLWIYTQLASDGTDGCHVTSFAYRLKHEGLWQIIIIPYLTAVSLNTRRVTVRLASARHLTHFPFIPTSGAVCLAGLYMPSLFITGTWHNLWQPLLMKASWEKEYQHQQHMAYIMILEKLWKINYLFGYFSIHICSVNHLSCVILDEIPFCHLLT